MAKMRLEQEAEPSIHNKITEIVVNDIKTTLLSKNFNLIKSNRVLTYTSFVKEGN